MARVSYDFLEWAEVREIVQRYRLAYCIAKNKYGVGPGKALLLHQFDYRSGAPVRQDWPHLRVSETEFILHLEKHHLCVVRPRSSLRPDFLKVAWQVGWRDYLVATGQLKRKRTRKDAPLWRYRRKHRRPPPT